jgi:hypothetical protein
MGSSPFDAEILHVRICGSPSGAIPGATRQLISCALTILQMNHSAAENQAQTRALAYIEQLRAEIVGSRWSFGSFKLRPF